MKELTIEQKAKAYDEAVERARKIHNDTEFDYEKGMVEEIFPELAMSEDEKIRKELISFLQSYDTLLTQKFIAWLEKQNSNIDNANKEYWRGYREGKQEILDKYAELEKQGEQKPAIIIPKFRVGDNIKTTKEAPLTITKIDDEGYWSEDLFICGFDDAAKWEIEQEPVWSEEDETNSYHLKTLLENLAKDIKHKFRVISYDDRDKYMAWLESLKDRIQSKQEWSEEDEKTWKELIEEVKDQLDSVPAPDCRDKEDEKALKQLTRWLVWLKSLKDKYTWKPSDEQINALSVAVKHGQTDDPDALKKLLEQLKKLKEDKSWKE